MDSKAASSNTGSQNRGLVPSLAVKRLSLYLRCLERMAESERTTVSSRQLGKALGLTDAQVRKDLGYFGQFGRPGVGYPVADLIERLRRILGTHRTWNVAIIGIGSLGRALLRHKGFIKKGFCPKAAFDSASRKIGRSFSGIVVRPMSELARTVKKERIRLVILTVPADHAQEVTDAVCQAGIKGILNFAPVTISVPKGVAVVPVDLAVQLEQLSYLLNALRKPRKNPSKKTKKTTSKKQGTRGRK